ncbi:MAG: MBL fold metallo-hydrolase [Candidatus Levybacteria bacterium]|nr:MBL fold metallo-hydrolase [Candidatus Levybacteria bacterium]
MKKFFLLFVILLFLLGSILIYQNIKFSDNNLHVVICDVGQGDAIFMRTPGGLGILIDGGPDDSVLSCLSKHMPFWDRTIEIVILTHPDADHITGLIDVIKRYSVTHFYTSKVQANTVIYKGFLKTLEDYSIKQNYLWEGDRFIFKDGVIMETLWPTQGWDSVVTNTFSVTQLLSYKNFKALFTGDLDLDQMEEVVRGVKRIDLLKIPHHGSRFGMSEEVLGILNPGLAVISVGAKNNFGHPTPFVLDLLRYASIKTMRTDQNGEVEIVSDGKSFKYAAN